MMKIVNFSEHNSIVNQYLAEIRDVDYQKIGCSFAITFNVLENWRLTKLARP